MPGPCCTAGRRRRRMDRKSTNCRPRGSRWPGSTPGNLACAGSTPATRDLPNGAALAWRSSCSTCWSSRVPTSTSGRCHGTVPGCRDASRCTSAQQSHGRSGFRRSCPGRGSHVPIAGAALELHAVEKPQHQTDGRRGHLESGQLAAL